MMLRSKKIKLGALVLSLTIAGTTLALNSIGLSAASSSDYQTALKKSVEFFDANKCGKDVTKDNVFSWRGACHTSDGSDVSTDLTGGYHDAGDHVKFGLPQGYAASVIGWSLYEFKAGHDLAGNTNKTLSTLKYFTDYFLKSHPNSNTFYYQCGDGTADHDYWGPPESQTGSRPTIGVANSSKGARDICGITSGALSLMYLNYKSVDSAYADKCLTAAKDLYQMALASSTVGTGQSFYGSTSGDDDLAWAAVWLYEVTKDSSYLDKAKSIIKGASTNWTMCWNDMLIATCVKIAQTGDSVYKSAVEQNLKYWTSSIKKTPGGLAYLNEWGVLRYSAAESMIALAYYKQSKNETYKTFAQSQLDYIMGKNPRNGSYIIGYGSNAPKQPHHRAANGYNYAVGINKDAKYELTGALVGGPNSNDSYTDITSEYTYTEVAIDYNAGLVGALAGMVAVSNGSISTTNNPQTTNPQTLNPQTSNPSSKLGDVNGDGKITSSDIALIERYVLGSINFNSNQMTAADVNRDSRITTVDSSLVTRYTLGVINNF